MKTKNLLLSVVLLVMLCLVLSVSCSDNIIDEASDTLVYATFDNRSRATSTYTQTITLKDIGDVYWTYTATKADSAGQTGATSAQTAVKSYYSKGLDGAIGPFSQGLWDFEVFGYATMKNDSESAPTDVGTDYVLVKDNAAGTNDVYYCTKIYYGKVTGVELKNGTQSNPDPINVIINLLKEGKGTFAISEASDFHWNTTGGNVHKDADTSNNTGAIDMYLKLEGRPENSRTDKTDYIKLSFVAADGATSAYYKIADNETISWSNTDATDTGFNLVASVVRTEATTADSVTTYQDLNTYATSSELFVKVYTGQTTTLEAKVIEGNFAYGEFNGTINTDGSITTTTVETVVDTSDTVLTSSVSPASASESTLSSDTSTTVTIPSDVKDFTSGSTAALTVTAYPIIAANSMFAISGDSVVVGGIDLTATVTTTTSSGDSGDTTTKTETVDKFTNSDGTAVAVTVETYVAKNMTSVSLSYTNSDGKTQTWSTKVESLDDITAPTGDDAIDGKYYYDSTSGKLVFKTTHFSTFLVASADKALNIDTNTAYQTLEAAIDAATAGDNIALLDDYGMATATKGYSITKTITIDLNQKTWGIRPKDVYVMINGTGITVTVKNGNILCDRNSESGGWTNSFNMSAGTLSLENVELTDTSDSSNGTICFYAFSHATSLKVKNSKLTTSGSGTVINVKVTVSNPARVEIENSEIIATGGGNAVSAGGAYATITIKDSTIKATAVDGEAIKLNGQSATTHTLNISNSDIIADGIGIYCGTLGSYVLGIKDSTISSISTDSSAYKDGAYGIVVDNSTTKNATTDIKLSGVKLSLEDTTNGKGMCISEGDYNTVTVTGTLTNDSVSSFVISGTPDVYVTQNGTAYVSYYDGITSAFKSNATEVELLNKVTTTMGTYPNDSDTYSSYAKQPIQWRVLDVDETNKRILVISEKVLPLPDDVRHSPTDSSTNYSWDKSGIKAWLNGSNDADFKTVYGLGSVSIATVKLETEKYADFTTKEKTTGENIFLLSYSEVALVNQPIFTGVGTSTTVYRVTESMYFSDESDQLAYDMNNALAQWWLRSPCSLNYESYNNATNKEAEYIQLLTKKDGYNVATFGFVSTNTQSGASVGVRPAFWVQVSTEE